MIQQLASSASGKALLQASVLCTRLLELPATDAALHGVDSCRVYDSCVKVNMVQSTRVELVVCQVDSRDAFQPN